MDQNRVAVTSANSSSPPWWALTPEAAVSKLASNSERGLSEALAGERLIEYGPNELGEEDVRSPWLMFGSQFANTMIVVLLIAAAVTVVIGDVKDAVVISAIVVLNASIGFVQEYRAEKAMAALKNMAAPSARVIRDGVETYRAAAELVPGDLIVLDPGDIVPADGRLVDAPNLRLNESALTGESVPVDKSPAPIAAAEGHLVAERANMVFKGTSVVYGRGRAVVVATGMNTALGGVAGLLRAHRAPQTPLQNRLAVLGRRLAVAALVVCAVVFVAGVARGEDVTLMFLTAVSLAVAAIPEALPAVVTIALALGAQRMVHQHALIRKLPAVETLGSVTVICTDKTGTLTQGRMMVERVWTLAGEFSIEGTGYAPTGSISPDPAAAGALELFGELVLAGALCNDAALVPPAGSEEEWSVTGDPTEAALLVLAAKSGIDLDRVKSELPRADEVPFDSDRKRMASIHHTGEGALVAAKGAAESLLEVVHRIRDPNGPVPLDDAMRARVLAAAADYSRAGYRVLGIAGGRISRPEVGVLRQEEDRVDLLGLVAMADPPRAESAAAVVACREAGITPVMITGDHPATGAAIADRLGLLDSKEVMTGAVLASEHAEGLGRHVDQVAVYARTSPEQKLDIVQAWQGRGDVVAMTGDGVNDAPALRAADIGVAMGVAGTEVAKEAADMVLTNDDFSAIVAAVGEGRRIYDNIRRFVRYTLTSNSGEIWVMFLGPFVGLPLPLLPVHILWINLVTDGLPGLALGVEPRERDVMRRSPRHPRESIFAHGLWQHVLLVGLLMGLIPLGLGLWGAATNRPWQTLVFTSLALLQLGHAMAVRSERESLRSLGLGSNRPLLYAVVGTLLLQLLVVYWGPMQVALETESLSLVELTAVLAASSGVFWAVELEKLVRRRTARRAAG